MVVSGELKMRLVEYGPGISGTSDLEHRGLRSGRGCACGPRLFVSRSTNPPWESLWIHMDELWFHMGMGQNPIPLVNIKIAGKWM
jgi:hypothetical protein